MKNSIRKAFLGEENKDLVFNNSDDALQHLADLTGKSVKVAGKKIYREFHVKMNGINNDNFVDNQAGEIAKILRELANRVENGDTSGGLKDTNGNTIGKFEYKKLKD